LLNQIPLPLFYSLRSTSDTIEDTLYSGKGRISRK
jgi:hypothetical protein